MLIVLGQRKGVCTYARDAQSTFSAKILRHAQTVNFSIPNCDSKIISYIMEDKILNYLNFPIDFILQRMVS